MPNTGRFRVTVVPTFTAVPPNNEERRTASTLRPAPQVEVAPTPTIGTQPGMRPGNSRLNQDVLATNVCGYSVPNVTRGTQDIAVEPTASLALDVLTAERTSARTLSDVPVDTDVTVTFLHASLEENGQGVSGRTDGCHFDFSCPWCNNIFSVRTYENKVFYVVDVESGDIQESYGVQEGLHVFCGSCKNTKPGINQGMLIEVSAPSADAQGCLGLDGAMSI